MRKTLTAVLATAVVGGLGLPTSPANAAETVTLHSGDLDTSQTRSAGHNDLLSNGVHVYTDDNSSNAKAAAYFELDAELSDVSNASMEAAVDGDFTVEPGQQIVFDAGTDAEDDGYNILVGEEVYENGEDEIVWWLTGGSSQAAKNADPSGDNNTGNGSEWFGTLEEWAAELPNAHVYAGGWSLGSGVRSSATITSQTYGGTTYEFTGDPASTSKVHENEIRPDETTYPGWHQGDDDGAENYSVTNDGLTLDGKAQVIYGYDEADFSTQAANLPLGWTLENASYTVAEGDAWFQVPLFFDYDSEGEAPDFTTLRPAASVSDGTHEISLSDEWVSSREIDGRIPEDTPTPLSEIVAALGTNYNVLGFGVYSDTGGSATVSQITWDDTRYEFVNRAPKAPKLTVETMARKPVKVELPRTDRDGNAVTYEIDPPVNGDADLNKAGTKVKYTPDKNFTGKDRFRYTATDEYGKSATGKVVVRVAKLKGHIADITVKPRKITTKKRARVTVRVKADGEAATGKVMIRSAGKVYGLKKLDDGKATIKIAKLKRGKHKLTAKYLGNKVTTKDSKKFTVRVVRR